jgi:hypothetical protein
MVQGWGRVCWPVPAPRGGPVRAQNSPGPRAREFMARLRDLWRDWGASRDPSGRAGFVPRARPGGGARDRELRAESPWCMGRGADPFASSAVGVGRQGLGLRVQGFGSMD